MLLVLRASPKKSVRTKQSQDWSKFDYGLFGSQVNVLININVHSAVSKLSRNSRFHVTEIEDEIENKKITQNSDLNI